MTKATFKELGVTEQRLLVGKISSMRRKGYTPEQMAEELKKYSVEDVKWVLETFKEGMDRSDERRRNNAGK